MAQAQKHAYRQAPWRLQLRGFAWVLVFLVVFVLVALISLKVSANTYAAGIKIQRLNRERESLNHTIADLKNDLGTATSYEKMVQRSADENFQTITDPNRIVYMVIPGYRPPVLHIEAPAQAHTRSVSVLKPAYTQSLWDLFLEGALKLNKNSKGSN